MKLFAPLEFVNSVFTGGCDRSNICKARKIDIVVVAAAAVPAANDDDDDDSDDIRHCMSIIVVCVRSDSSLPRSTLLHVSFPPFLSVCE